MDILEFDKIPPQDLDLEEIVLGTIISSPDILPDVIDILTGVEVFYKDAHQKIYQAILNLSIANNQLDLMTITNELRKMDVLEDIGGAFFVTNLTRRIAGSGHVQMHSAILQELFIRREIIRLSEEHKQEAFNMSIDLQDILIKVSKSGVEISDGLFRDVGMHISDVIEETNYNVKQINSGQLGTSLIPTGYNDVDRKLGGFAPGDLIILAARPGCGKTSLAINIAKNVADIYKIPVGIFSLEMSRLQLTQRLISGEGKFNNNFFKSSMSHDILDKYITASEYISKLDIFIDDNARLNHMQFASKCRKMVRKNDVKLIIVDYLQLLSGTNDKRNYSREQEVSEISRFMKITAKDLDIPIICLSQMSRSVESRTGTRNRPQLSDLRESGQIEANADIVIFLHDPNKYGIHQDDNGKDLNGLVEFIVEKNRNGATFSSYLGFQKEYTMFVNEQDKIYNLDNLQVPNKSFDLQLNIDLPE